MLKWLRSKLKRKPRVIPPEVFDYGRYEYKPVIARALSVVMNCTQQDVLNLVAATEVHFNGELLQPGFTARPRLESGQYEVKIPSQNRVYRFFIL